MCVCMFVCVCMRVSVLSVCVWFAMLKKQNQNQKCTGKKALRTASGSLWSAAPIPSTARDVHWACVLFTLTRMKGKPAGHFGCLPFFGKTYEGCQSLDCFQYRLAVYACGGILAVSFVFVYLCLSVMVISRPCRGVVWSKASNCSFALGRVVKQNRLVGE